MRKAKTKVSVQDKAVVQSSQAVSYNEFVTGVQPLRIELGEVSASAKQSDLAQVDIGVESKFTLSCLRFHAENKTFDIEAQLQLFFLSESGEQVAKFAALYHLGYHTPHTPSAELLDLFAHRNAPLQVWPFMRELVLNLTQRFGWTGFMLPSFVIPPVAADATPSKDSLSVFEAEQKERNKSTKTHAKKSEPQVK